ncbi:MAG: sugar ABC transporter ATP-binding protein [Christensenellales bacterium]|jgi:inositol transport system ATP-binding protein
MDNNYLLKMDNITMRFPGVLALDDVHFYVRPGTVHALMGENGAGKSTLMKVLIGIYTPNSGTISFKGKKLENKSINDALESGISMIHQELSSVLEMTVAENIFLGRELMFGPFVRTKEIEKKTHELFEQLNVQDIKPEQKMRELSTAKMQLVEIAKAISYNADLIIMDEPTSAITEREVDHLFTMIRQLRDRGISIIYITHKMDEVFEISDDVTVLRDGQFISMKEAAEMTKDSLIELMVGREVGDIFVKTESEIGDVILSVRNFTKKGEFKDINFDVRRGEIFGFAGLVGAGRSEVIMSVFGANKPDSGEVSIDGEKVRIKTPHDAIRNGMALLTEDRKLTGLFLSLDVKDNITLASLDDFIKNGLVQHKRVRSTSEKEVVKFDIKTPSVDQQTQFLSGGNQQKVLVSRWMLTQPKILVMDEPTRGIDVGAKAEIHRLMSEYAAAGGAVIMVSSELPEIIGMSDRVLVMHEGEQMAILNRDQLTQERILAYAAGERDIE